MNRGWVWTRRPRSPHPTLEMLHPSDGAPLRGWEHGASLVQLLVLPWDRLPFISPSPQGSQQQTTDGGRGERNIEEEKKGSFGRGGGGASAELVHSQLQVNPVCLSKLGWCVREQSVNITLFPPALSRGYGWETEAFFYMHVKAQFSLSSLWSVSLQATAPAWTRMLKLLNISAEE